MLAAAATSARAEEVRAGDIVIDQVWGRATVGTGAGAFYLTLRNAGATPERLLGVDTPAAERAELHVHSMDGDVMRMRAAEAVEIAPGDTVTLAPGGTHIMLMGLTAPLEEGQSVPLTLRFESAGAVAASATIGPVGAKGP